MKMATSKFVHTDMAAHLKKTGAKQTCISCVKCIKAKDSLVSYKYQPGMKSAYQDNFQSRPSPTKQS